MCSIYADDSLIKLALHIKIYIKIYFSCSHRIVGLKWRDEKQNYNWVLSKLATTHHFLPRFYLNAFVDPSSRDLRNPFLWVVELQSKILKQKAPKNVASITGFYDWRELKAIAPLIEPIYSQIESRTACVMRKLWNGDLGLTDKDKYHLSIFLGLQLTRTPRFRRASQDAMIKYVLDRAENLVGDEECLQKSLDKFNVEDIKSFVKNRRFNVVPNPDHILQMTLKSGLAFSVLIFAMQWLFVIAREELRFFTSDVPVALLTPDAKPRRIDFDAYYNSELEISFPISPSCILLLREQEFPENVAFAGDDVVNEINRRIFPVADKYVFCSSEQQGRWVLAQEISTGIE